MRGAFISQGRIFGLQDVTNARKDSKGMKSPLIKGGNYARRSKEHEIGSESNKWDSKKGENMATREQTNPKVDKKIYHNTASVTKSINLMKKRYRGGIRL